jgi:hypothetical protein
MFFCRFLDWGNCLPGDLLGVFFFALTGEEVSLILFDGKLSSLSALLIVSLNSAELIWIEPRRF